MKTSSVVGIVVFIIAVAAGSFYAGSSYGPLFAQPGVPTQLFGGSVPPVSVFGVVSAKSATSMTLLLGNGGSQTVSLSTTTSITSAPTTIAASSIKSGDSVSIVGTAGADGSITAQAVQVIPPPPVYVAASSTAQ